MGFSPIGESLAWWEKSAIHTPIPHRYLQSQSKSPSVGQHLGALVMGRGMTSAKARSGDRAPRRTIGRLQRETEEVASSVDQSEAETEGTTSTRVSRGQKTSTGIQDEIKAKKEVKSSGSGRRMSSVEYADYSDENRLTTSKGKVH